MKLSPEFESRCGRVTLYRADCFAVQASLAAGSIDRVITDPPYEIALGGSSGKSIGPCRKHNSAALRAISRGFDVERSVRDWRWLMRHQDPRHGGSACVFCSNAQLGRVFAAFTSLGWPPTVLAWFKTNSVPFANNTWRPTIEFIVHARDRGAPLHGTAREKTKLWSLPTVRPCFGHPTVKPLSLIRDLVRITTNPGDVVFDPYMGSATTAVACLELGRRFIGVERNRQYFARAVERVKVALESSQ
jgi:site-specific DNA-methyltransferase (adenine-specific)